MEVKEKVVAFPSYMKDKLNTFVKTSNLDIVYENGKIITLSKTNVEVIVPHIIIFVGKNENFKLLYYGDYDENRNRFYTMDLKEEISYTKLREVVDIIKV